MDDCHTIYFEVLKMAGNNNKLDIWERELWTQGEVASYFRVSESTIKNWRDRGLLSYWQAPGSTKVLYYRDEIKDFRDSYTKKKGGDKKQTVIRREKPCVSPSRRNTVWRI